MHASGLLLRDQSRVPVVNEGSGSLTAACSYSCRVMSQIESRPRHSSDVVDGGSEFRRRRPSRTAGQPIWLVIRLCRQPHVQLIVSQIAGRSVREVIAQLDLKLPATATCGR